MKIFKKSEMLPEYVKTISVVTNPEDNGGESITLSVDVYDNGDETDDIFYNLNIEVNCYGASKTTLNLFNIDIDSLINNLQLIKENLK